MAEGTQLAVQIEELNQNLKLVSAAVIDLSEQLRQIQLAKKISYADQVHRASGYVNWNSTHDVLKTEEWITMSAFLECCLKYKREDFNNIQVYVVDEETRFPEDELYVNVNNPVVRAKILYIETCKARGGVEFEVERILDISKGEAHTVSSFEKEHGLKWVNPTSEVSYESEPEPIQTAKPVSKTVIENSAPISWAAEKLIKLDSDVPETSSKKEDPLSVEDQKLYKNFAYMLDRISDSNYCSILKEIKELFLEVNNEKRLELVTELLFDKAVDNPDSTYWCAVIAREVATTKVPSDNDPNAYVNFRSILIGKFQKNFEEMFKMKREDLDDETNIENRMFCVRIVRFIGELYKVRILTSKIVDYCLTQLSNDDLTSDKLECFCELIAIVGKQFDNRSKMSLEKHFRKLHDIINREDNHDNINGSVMIMIQDIIDLRKRKWVINAPQLIKNLPKTIDEIQDENNRRALLIQLMNEFGLSAIEQKEQTKAIHKDHNRELAGLNLYSVETLKREAASQKTQDYIQDPPECFTELDGDILDKLQADRATQRDIPT